ncbi:MAG: acyltransferase family protein [Thermodesulfobacteriota bacterium]
MCGACRQGAGRNDAFAVPRRTTDTLKAVAILGVVLSHFASHEITRIPALVSVFNSLMGLFFILGGVGIEASLERRFATGITARTILRFFFDRALRIYPAYLLAIFSSDLLFGTHYSLAVYTGLVSPYWFITYMLHCYLAAPILHLGIARLGARRFALIATAAIVAANLPYHLSASVPSSPESALPDFKAVLFGHILLFVWGMCFFSQAKKPRNAGQALTHPVRAWLLWAALLLYLPCAALAGMSDQPPLPAILASTGLYLSLAAVTHMVLSGQLAVPAGKAFAAVGRATLLIYLFEPFFYFALSALYIVPDNVPSILLYAVTMPLFLLLCVTVQPLFDATARLPRRFFA